MRLRKFTDMKKTAFLLLSVLAVACGDESAEKPKRLLSEDEMANIMYDMTMLQSVRSSQPQLLETHGVNPKDYVFSKYKIDSLTLAQNNAWYANDMEQYEKILKRVSERIKKEKDAASKNRKINATSPSPSPSPVATPANDSVRQVLLDKRKRFGKR